LTWVEESLCSLVTYSKLEIKKEDFFGSYEAVMGITSTEFSPKGVARRHPKERKGKKKEKVENRQNRILRQ